MTNHADTEDISNKFHLEEFALLRSKLDHTVSRSENLIILLSVASGTIVYLLYPFVSSADRQSVYGSYFIAFMSWLPLIINFVGYLYFRELRRGIRRIGAYIMRIEGIFATENLGWERHWLASRGRKHVRFFSAMTLGYFFLFLFSGSFGAFSTWLLFHR
jgi:hypothetical protein